MSTERQAVHPDPVWRDRADFIIAARLADAGGTGSEQLWARQLAPLRFELCCIPFFLYDLALGDVVETDDTYVVRQVSQPSGRFVFRVWFGDTAFPRDVVAAALEEMGTLLEWSSVNLLAIDARDEDHAGEVAQYLADAERRGELMYETGRS